MRNGDVESSNDRMRGDILNESLFFGLSQARSDLAERRQGFNIARPHSSFDYLNLAAFAGTLNAPCGVTESAETLIAAG